MHYSSLVAALCVGGVLASPIEKREYVTDLTIVTKTVYVTADAEATPAPAANGLPRWSWKINYPPTQPTSEAPPPPPPSTEAPPPPPEPTHDAPPPPAKTQPESAPPSNNDYKGTVLYHHNIHRSNHSAEALTWDDNLESSARQLAETCVYGHNTKYGGGGYGQNIGYQSGYSSVAAMITNLMYNGEAPKFDGLYGQSNPGGNFHDWGHFTQIVWKGTKNVACYTKRCSTLRVGGGGSSVNNADFIVCNYGPPGNYAGRYDQNVGRPLGNPTVSV
ncbi:hypothetical protein PRK78_001290 [Emydomyces testavorans]|uniref:SCP domain-containing protein n=1 Tax=Emydomyces testavorans TaxID=2070801 RepID=A0AAF0IGJ6_9EURO|nr:hypothetical protein PRK78_001290 [Emydomyces testavorans]